MESKREFGDNTKSNDNNFCENKDNDTCISFNDNDKDNYKNTTTTTINHNRKQHYYYGNNDNKKQSL